MGGNMMQLRIVGSTDNKFVGEVVISAEILTFGDVILKNLRIKSLDNGLHLLYNANYIMTCEEILG
jgi:hypothetical protein